MLTCCGLVSLGIKSDKALATKSGTSMACPHAVGAAAIFTSVSTDFNEILMLPTIEHTLTIS
jgi:subtilisin family serine protease